MAMQVLQPFLNVYAQKNLLIRPTLFQILYQKKVTFFRSFLQHVAKANSDTSSTVDLGFSTKKNKG